MNDTARPRTRALAMIAVLSPAKTLDYRTPHAPVDASAPRFAAEAAALAAAAGRLGPKRLGELMHISPKLARLNIDRFRAFDAAKERPAMFAYAGDVYRGFEARSLAPEALPFAQDHLRVLSGLYGLLRPFDAIRPHRLEMGARWAPRRKALTDWWGAQIADALAADVAKEGSGAVLNLASQEYWAGVAPHLPGGVRVIVADFRQAHSEGPRFESFAAKRARGTMARWVVEHRINDVDALPRFDNDGYRFVGAEGDLLRFVRG